MTEIEAKLDLILKILNDHTSILKKHGEILDDHSEKLDVIHTRLDDHGEKLERLLEWIPTSAENHRSMSKLKNVRH